METAFLCDTQPQQWEPAKQLLHEAPRRDACMTHYFSDTVNGFAT